MNTGEMAGKWPPVHRLLLRSDVPEGPRPAVFLDRDGVVNSERRYVGSKEDFEFMPGVLAASRSLVDAGFALVVVTNQAGIARGFYGFEEFRELSGWMAAEFLAAGAPLDGVYYCPHHPEAAIPDLRCRCACRKPEPGMLLAAAVELNLDLSSSVLIGDKLSDLLAGRRAGVSSCLLVRPRGVSGNFSQDLPGISNVIPDAEVESLAEAHTLILGKPHPPR